MCGIFGLISKNFDDNVRLEGKKILSSLFKMSESRGKEASGLIALYDDQIKIIKDSVPASDLIKQKNYKKLINDVFSSTNQLCTIGHSRLVTNGESFNNKNNQPLFSQDIIAVHNGIITNEKKIKEKYTDLEISTELDTEVMINLINKFLNYDDILSSIKKSYNEIEGVANLAILFKNLNSFLLTTNNGSLYYIISNSNNSLVFASEKFILKKCIQKIKNYADNFSLENINQLKANSGLHINTKNFDKKLFKFDDEEKIYLSKSQRYFSDLSKQQKDNLNNIKKREINLINNDELKLFNSEYEINKEKISKLKRCINCILPETMPYIKFDDNGKCNYCSEYSFKKPKGLTALKKIFENDNHLNCLATFSGGRDSSYGLHVLKKKLGLDILSYTYDWGMVTDLARRNQMRICGSLGIEHILVSADIVKKRNNIKKNVSAWLKKPELGMIPLFMAGDKQYFYWGNKIAEQNNCKKILLFENLLETTKFKSGFCGIKPAHGTRNTYTLSIKNKISLIFYYLKNFIKNPSYINSSILDTFSAFFSYYVLDHEWINLFDYIDWDEKEINKVLKQDYNWEVSSDTSSTWRIGDGTASFYNYIYYTMAGFTENDTFRSNQIRQGKISREDALNLSINENKPRFESINEYLNIIGLDFSKTLKKINMAKKIY